MRRTAGARLDHPGLDTSATRDGDTLLIQNDIGTNDAHVLVLQVRKGSTTLTYSDLHRARFAFFREGLARIGASWGETRAREDAALNEGKAFHVGIATFEATDAATQCAQLEGIGSRIVCLIDWNRARKQLAQVVGKQVPLQVLQRAATNGCGHVAWLKAGGARLVWDAMAAQGDAGFRLGERLDDVLTAEAARDFLSGLLELAWRSAQAGQPPQFVGDEARLLLARVLAGRHRGFVLLQEHAAVCHALASALHGAASGCFSTPCTMPSRTTWCAWRRSACRCRPRSCSAPRGARMRRT